LNYMTPRDFNRMFSNNTCFNLKATYRKVTDYLLKPNYLLK